MLEEALIQGWNLCKRRLRFGTQVCVRGGLDSAPMYFSVGGGLDLGADLVQERHAGLGLGAKVRFSAFCLVLGRPSFGA